MFPTIAEYNQVIRTHGVDAFRTLHGLTFVPSRTLPVKIFSFGSGAYAVVFKAKAQYKEYAIRCFISADNETLNRYRSICDYLVGINESWCTEIELLEDEIDVHGRYYPVVKMEWVNGQLLNKYISENLHNNTILTKLQEQVVQVSDSLEKHTIGHGDIQCGNVVITKDATGNPIIKLIDYDGLYIPEFANKKNLEHGRSEFQHPQRSQSYFNERIDRFSFWVMLTALEALKHDKSLWLEVMQGGFNTLDNLLFTGEDFKDFRKSKLVQRLSSLNNSALTYYLTQLEHFCKSPISTVAAPKIYTLPTVTPPVSSPQNHSTNPNVAIGQNQFIEIISSPAGASVLTTTLKWIGQTPLKLEKSKYVGKTLVISFGSQVKQSVVSDSTRLIDVSFKEEEPVKVMQIPEPKPRIKDLKKPQPVYVIHPPKPSTAHNTSAAQQPVYPSYSSTPAKPNTKRKKKEKSSNVFFAILLLLGVAVVLIAIAYNNQQSSYDSDYSEVAESYEEDDVEVDTTAIVGYHVASSNSARSTDNRSVSSQRLVSSKDDYGITANEVVWNFFTALNNRDCDRAWNLTFIDYWENKGKGYFCDSNEYGGIIKSNITIYESIILSNNEMIFEINYSITHKHKQLQYYKQYFTVSKIKNGDDNLKWYITDMENISN